MSHRNPEQVGSTRRKLIDFARQLADRLFAVPDAQARANGWTVSRSPSGLGRVYRDPRIRLLVPCPACAGDGCRSCGGRGRVLPAVAVPAPRPAVSVPRPAGTPPTDPGLSGPAVARPSGRAVADPSGAAVAGPSGPAVAGLAGLADPDRSGSAGAEAATAGWSR
jgi:hypothetical protein